MAPMRCFLVEIPLQQIGPRDSERALGALRTAQSRLGRSGIIARLLFAGTSRDDDRLICLMEASAMPAVRALVALALLPAGRVRELTSPTCPARLGVPTES
jgi:hypothetical protein